VSHQLSNAQQRLTATPYEGIYVEVVGFYAGPTSNEYAFEGRYEGLFEIEKVMLTRKSSPSDCKAK
jgi:hypothetical protein